MVKCKLQNGKTVFTISSFRYFATYVVASGSIFRGGYPEYVTFTFPSPKSTILTMSKFQELSSLAITKTHDRSHNVLFFQGKGKHRD